MDCYLKNGWVEKIAPIANEAGFDLDYEWQVPQLDYWLKNGNK